MALVEWQEALDEEYQARNSLTPALADGVAPPALALRHWWSTVSRVWKLYALSVARAAPPTPPPADLANIMADLAGYLAVGQIPDPIRDAASEGRRNPGPDEARDIGFAVAYHRAARPGLMHNGVLLKLDDRHPTKTIAAKYNVAPSTVRKWNRSYEPAFLGTNSVTVEILENLMSKAAARYRAAGRSHSAIAARGAKYMS